MAIISIPASLRIRNIEWTATDPDLVNRSPWTGRSRVFDLAKGQVWSASFEVVPLIGQVNAQAVRGFLAALRGRKNSFRLVAVETPQRTGSNPVTTLAAPALQNLLSVSGFPASQVVLPQGGLISVVYPSGDEQMMVLDRNVLSDSSGNALLIFEPGLRMALPMGSSVETILPTCLMRNAQPSYSWAVSAGQQYSYSLTCEEAW